MSDQLSGNYFVRSQKVHACCASHCRDFIETQNGIYPASDHSPSCKNFKLIRFSGIFCMGAKIIDTPENTKKLAKSLDDDLEEYRIKDVFLTQDQFDKMQEFEGF